MALEMGADFLRRKGVPAFLLATLAAGLVGFGAYSFFPVEYRAVAQVRITAPKDSYPDNFLKTQKDFVTSSPVLNAALNLPEAKALPFVQDSLDPVSVLRSRLKVESEPNSEIFDISMSGVDAEEVQTLVNAVIDAYVERSKDTKTVALENEEAILKQQVTKNETEIERLRRLQRSLADEVGQPDPDSTRTDLDNLNKEVAEKRKQRDDLRLRKLSLTNEIELLESSPPSLTPEEERELRDRRDKPLEEALAKLELRAESIRTNSLLGERDPEYIRVMNYVNKQRTMVEQEIGEQRGQLLERARERQNRNIEALKGNLKVVEETERLLDTQRLALEGRIEKIQKVVADIDGYRAKIGELQTSVSEINKNLQEISRSTLANNISVYKAELPRIASSGKKRLLAMAGGPVGAFGFVLLLFWLVDYRLKLVGRAEHLQRIMPVPVLGILPIIPKEVALPAEKDYAETNKYHRQWIAMLEAINSLRITLTYSPHRQLAEGATPSTAGVASLLVTSARDGEGKSTLSAHLALSFARAGARVVLVEADMHRPTQFERFGVERSPGLADVLQGTVDISEAIHETTHSGLYLLCAGSMVDDLTGILTPEKLETTFGYLRDRYDTIIIDAPPVLPVYDALLLARQAEQTLLCAMCNHSQTYAIQQALHRLESVGVNVTGLVVAGSAPSSKYQYYYAGKKGTRADAPRYPNRLAAMADEAATSRATRSAATG
jgi:capsular exopolysaccharide synthesis family protein